MPLFQSYKTWLKQHDDYLTALSKGAQLLETSLGTVEINYKDSEKNTIDPNTMNTKIPTLLIVHGGCGGHDQGLGCFDMLFGEGYHVLSFSRPGYCRTPLSSGGTFEAQAS